MSIGASIQKTIYDQGRSVRQVAFRAGISSQTIYQWIWGKSDPTISLLLCVADVLSVTLDELVGRTVAQ